MAEAARSWPGGSPARPWSRRSITSATTNSRTGRGRLAPRTGRAAGVASDDPAAVATIAGLIDRIGYDPVRLESLRAGRVLQPGGPVFGVVLTRPEFERAVREDARSLT